MKLIIKRIKNAITNVSGFITYNQHHKTSRRMARNQRHVPWHVYGKIMIIPAAGHQQRFWWLMWQLLISRSITCRLIMNLSPSQHPCDLTKVAMVSDKCVCVTVTAQLVGLNVQSNYFLETSEFLLRSNTSSPLSKTFLIAAYYKCRVWEFSFTTLFSIKTCFYILFNHCIYITKL